MVLKQLKNERKKCFKVVQKSVNQIRYLSHSLHNAHTFRIFAKWLCESVIHTNIEMSNCTNFTIISGIRLNRLHWFRITPTQAYGRCYQRSRWIQTYHYFSWKSDFFPLSICKCEEKSEKRDESIRKIGKLSNFTRNIKTVNRKKVKQAVSLFPGNLRNNHVFRTEWNWSLWTAIGNWWDKINEQDDKSFMHGKVYLRTNDFFDTKSSISSNHATNVSTHRMANTSDALLLHAIIQKISKISAETIAHIFDILY